MLSKIICHQSQTPLIQRRFVPSSLVSGNVFCIILSLGVLTKALHGTLECLSFSRIFHFGLDLVIFQRL